MWERVKMAEGEDEVIVRSNGWFEIRSTAKDGQWIATDEPIEVKR